MSERLTTSAPGGADPDRPRVRASVLANAPQRVLLIVAVISVLVHVGLAYVLYDQPLGYVSPEAMQQRSQTVNFRGAVYEPTTNQARGAGEDAPDEPTDQAIANALLEETSDPPAPSDAEPELNLREMPDRQARRAARDLSVQVPAFELSEDMLAELSGQAPGELGYRGGGDGNGGSGVGGDGDGSGGGGADVSEAQRLLAEAGFAGDESDGGAGMPVPGGDAFEDTAPMEKRLLEAPLGSPQIDFAGVALESTTQLDVPEHLDQDFNYELHRYNPGNERGYFRVDITAKRSLRKLETMPKDVVFLVDTSSSVPEPWVEQVIRGVRQGLSALNDNDRFNIVLFNEQPAFFSGESIQPATRENIQRASEWLTSAESKGWTDVNAALSQLLRRDLETERVYDIVLISDGRPTRGVIDTRELLNVITRDNDLVASIYCVGVGRQQNHELLEFLAYRNKGFCRFVENIDDTAGTIRGLMSRIRYPLIKNLKLGLAGAQINEVYPDNLPTIHQGEELSIFGRYVEPSAFTMRITGQNAGQDVDFTFSRNLRTAPAGGDQIATDWAFWKLHHLYSRIMREGETDTLEKQIDYLRRKYELKTLY